jgi:hypothetical protein
MAEVVRRLGAFNTEVAWMARYDTADRRRTPTDLFYADNSWFNRTGEARELPLDDPRVVELLQEAARSREAFEAAKASRQYRRMGEFATVAASR